VDRAESAGEPDGGPTATSEPTATSRWDRPPPPHDWRYYVNRAGRTLITLGLLLFGFVAYQLWGTGIQTARAQHRLEVQFEEALAAAGETTAPGTTPVTTTPATTAPSTTVPGTQSTTTAPLTSPLTSPPTSPPTSGPPATSAPVVTAPTTPAVASGRALAKLEIPKIDKSLYVLPGVDVETLHDGPGHYPDTPLPGQLGNSAIAGHRTTSGAPFGDIDELEPGDELIVTMTTGDRFVYQVTETLIVDPSEYWVVQTDDPTVAMLTLTSCHPEYTARQRIVVRSILKPAESAPASEPTFYDLEDDQHDGDGTPSATTVVDGVPIPATVPGEPASGDDGPDTATGADTATGPDIVTDGVDAPADGGPDGLTSGWFDDAAAWPHVIGWGAACMLLALSASWLSRRFRSYLIGVAVVTVPFVVTLFFFYENVNRLLPAGI
jgi:sortase A